MPLDSSFCRNGSPADPPTRTSFWAAVVCGVLVAGVPAAIWPGDASWFWDEPLELAIALAANREGQLAARGLFGGFPVPYGPLGIQVLQVGLLLTDDPRLLVVWHAMLCAVPTAAALFWLSRTLRLPVWFAVGVLASPYLWFESRRLWQPSFCIPLGAMAVASYASFLSRPARKSLLLAIACAIAPVLIHLQSLPLSAVILGHLLLRHRSELWRARWQILAILAAFAVLTHRYLLVAGWCLVHYFPQILQAGHSSSTSLSIAWWGPLLAGSLFSGWDWMTVPHVWGRIVRCLSSIPILLTWAGTMWACWKLLRRSNCGGSACAWPPAAAGSVLRTICAISLAGLGVQVALCAILRVSREHHQYFGTFGLHVFLAWVAVAAIPRSWLRGLVIGAYSLSAGATTAYWIDQVHRYSWPRWFAPTLGEQIAVAQALNSYSDRFAYTEVPAYWHRPELLGVLRELYPPDLQQARHYSGRLFIRFRAGPAGKTDGIELTEAEHLPPEARLIPLDAVPPELRGGSNQWPRSTAAAPGMNESACRSPDDPPEHLLRALSPRNSPFSGIRQAGSRGCEG